MTPELARVIGIGLGFSGSLIVLFTTGNVKASALHSSAIPRWAHWTAWGLLSASFVLQFYAALSMMLPVDR